MRAVPSLSNAPVTVKLIVVPIEAASAARNEPALNEPATTFVDAAAALAATLAAAATPPFEVVEEPPPEGTEIVGIAGTLVEGVEVFGMFIEGALIFAMSFPPKMLFAKL